MSKTVQFNGKEIEFIYHDGMWLASFYDICEAFELNFDEIWEFFDYNEIPYYWLGEDEDGWGAYLDEIGIYNVTFFSNFRIAQKFKMWTATVLSKLRKWEGLEAYEMFRMFDEDIQEHIDSILSTVYYNDEDKKLYKSVTVNGGDVEQIPLDEFLEESA